LPTETNSQQHGELLPAKEIFDKSSNCIARLVNKIWLCRYPRCCCFVYSNSSEFKLHFEYRCKSYGTKCKPTMVKNPQANAMYWNACIKSFDRCYVRVAETLISKIFVDVEFHQTSKYYLVWMTHACNMWKRRPSFFQRFLCTLGLEACRLLVFCLVDVNPDIRRDVRY
jgi:hypothetical protein